MVPGAEGERMTGREELRIEYIPIEELVPYEGNARKHRDKDISAIAESIRDYGFNDPIGIWKGNIIVEGHGRLMAAKKNGMIEVPCIRLDHMTDEQRREYALAHNKTAELSQWDADMLKLELENLPEFEMEKFGFDMEDMEEGENERLRTDEKYKLPQITLLHTEGYYQMPKLQPVDYTPKRLIGFNYALSSNEYDAGIHFYIDDYQFERIWNDTARYVEVLKKFDCILTPDFSLYMDMPMAMKIWNTFRSRLIGQICQQAGLIVIPTISWAEKETLDWCFDGVPEKATVSISTVGVRKNRDAMKIWKMGTEALIEKKHPKRILLYGGGVEHDFNDIEIVEYANEVTERMKEN